MVAQHYADNPELAVWLDRLWLHDVFRAPWFAAIHLLLVEGNGFAVSRTLLYTSPAIVRSGSS
ncbi:cytochrome c biogenesis protein ResB [Nonomuraea sp. NPDC049504]|uniref:cytochrome c biogenesis protein ResB n=1 Tax=Nonomuraea sp. NPDC049504 TaxID=3154729 RepID=UPI00343D11F0